MAFLFLIDLDVKYLFSGLSGCPEKELADYWLIKAIEIEPLFSSKVFLGQDPLDHVALTGPLSCLLEVTVKTIPTFSFLLTCQPFTDVTQWIQPLATSLAEKGLLISRKVPLGVFPYGFCFNASKRSRPESRTVPPTPPTPVSQARSPLSRSPPTSASRRNDSRGPASRAMTAAHRSRLPSHSSAPTPLSFLANLGLLERTTWCNTWQL